MGCDTIDPNQARAVHRGERIGVGRRGSWEKKRVFTMPIPWDSSDSRFEMDMILSKSLETPRG